MKRILITLICLAITPLVHSQTKITGTVFTTDKKPIAYVNIGFRGTPIGTISDKNGYFELSYDKTSISKSNSLKFSMIGFYSQSIPKDSLKYNINLKLRKKIVELEEVIVLSNGLKHKKIGKFKNSVLNMACNFSLPDYENQNKGSEIAKKFNMANKSNLIDSLHFFILQNNYDTVGFRINIYSVHKNKPDKNLLTHDIIYEITNKAKGWQVVDLTPYNIEVQNAIIVSLQWLYKSKKGNILSLPITMPSFHTHYYRYGCQNTWKKFKYMTTTIELDIRN